MVRMVLVDEGWHDSFDLCFGGCTRLGNYSIQFEVRLFPKSNTLYRQFLRLAAIWARKQVWWWRFRCCEQRLGLSGLLQSSKVFSGDELNEYPMLLPEILWCKPLVLCDEGCPGGIILCVLTRFIFLFQRSLLLPRLVTLESYRTHKLRSSKALRGKELPFSCGVVNMLRRRFPWVPLYCEGMRNSTIPKRLFYLGRSLLCIVSGCHWLVQLWYYSGRIGVWLGIGFNTMNSLCTLFVEMGPSNVVL